MLELADIFRRYGPDYRAQFQDRMPPSHLRALRDIQACRTETLGGQVYLCPPCHPFLYRYHSCKNRHCPKCQNDSTTLWLNQQRHLLLPVSYFLIPFTLPEELRSLTRSHQKVLYRLLFQVAAAALQKLALDPKLLGGQIGMMGVLQTWARDLSYHPHVHFVVPGGGLSPVDHQWLPTGERFFLPAKPLSILFRAKFRDALKQVGLFDQVPSPVWKKDWVVDCQPAGNGEQVLKYLAPYVYRIALSNQRLVSRDGDQVTFRYKDPARKRWRTLTLPALEFIRRFLQHVLPQGFVKVRYYGFLSSTHRQSFQTIQTILRADQAPEPPTPSVIDEKQAPDSPTLGDAPRCPNCGSLMILVQTLSPFQRAPP